MILGIIFFYILVIWLLINVKIKGKWVSGSVLFMGYGECGGGSWRRDGSIGWFVIVNVFCLLGSCS